MEDDPKISLRYALGWIYARDLKFAALAGAKTDVAIEDLWLEFNASRNSVQLPLVPSTAKAWEQLSKARMDGKISLYGTRNVLDKPSPGKSDPLITGPVQPIGELCRHLTEVGISAGVRWVEVTLPRSPLLACFPPRPKARAAPSGSAPKLSKKMMLIQKALENLPENVPLLDEVEQHKVINAWIKENAKRSKGAVTVSTSTIKRYLKPK